MEFLPNNSQKKYCPALSPSIITPHVKIQTLFQPSSFMDFQKDGQPYLLTKSVIAGLKHRWESCSNELDNQQYSTEMSM